ncbi:unnamed protein product [Adineta steineri]|uniref:Sugar phosphate transporter domain-containing protein n=2 Tax=Adineta steineri TaxID=433720 RepID=A0A818Z4L7_9BILA|nr:unnamed protein product [Adineta steineri]CAF0952667.1 unnamed protein product [Adineta steineri]CAF0966869.1 unnamed protein product [Adineta steineri]CAF3656994.1 unnamed protein product [Adineta steineri]CAF3764823.1 unnamed protein product [Adineta steineri]
MNNSSYELLNNSTDKLDVVIPVKESASSSTSNNASGDTLKSRYIQIAIAVGLYWFVSITMVFLNKYLLSSKDVKLDAPLFITWFQCVVTVGICGILGSLNKSVSSLSKFPSFKIDLKIARDVLPLSLMFVAMIIFNNLTLKHLTVSFYMVGRSLTTVANVVFTYFMLGERTSYKALGCCALIIAGFFLGIDQENALGTLSLFGASCGIASSIFVALNAIYTTRCLPCVDKNVWRLCLYNNFNACILFLPLMIIFGELPIVFSYPKLLSISFLTPMILAGFLGFSMGYVTGYQIQMTSPLTHNVSGTAKSYVQTLLAVMIYIETKTTLWWISNLFVLGGSGLFAHVRAVEMKRKHNLNNTTDNNSNISVSK